MSDLVETDIWEAGIYQLEQVDPVDAGVAGAGVSNLQPYQLANRTGYLKSITDSLINNTLSLSGDPAQFDSSQLIATTNFVRISQMRFSDAVRITGTQTLTNTHIGKLLNIEDIGANSDVTTLMGAASVPPGAAIHILHQRKNPMKWQAAEPFNMYHFNADAYQHLAAGTDNFYTCQGDIITLVRSEDNTTLGASTPYWYILVHRGNLFEVGAMIYYPIDLSPNPGGPIGTIQCQGQLVNRADYPRLWNIVNLTFGPIADGTWTGSAAQQGHFSTGNGSTTFRLPSVAKTNVQSFLFAFCKF